MKMQLFELQKNIYNFSIFHFFEMHYLFLPILEHFADMSRLQQTFSETKTKKHIPKICLCNHLIRRQDLSCKNILVALHQVGFRELFFLSIEMQCRSLVKS